MIPPSGASFGTSERVEAVTDGELALTAAASF
jgi:hypothetical protein